MNIAVCMNLADSFDVFIGHVVVMGAVALVWIVKLNWRCYDQ